MKTKEELNAIIEEVETVSKKLQELTEEELEKVNGGVVHQRSLQRVGRATSKVFGNDDCELR